MKIYLESLGCPKNQVDSEIMLGRLIDDGHTIINDPYRAEIIIINTCSFIEDAINESIDTILELACLKKQGDCKRLIVAGCLPQRFGKDIAAALSEVDIFLGTGAFDQIIQAVNNPITKGQCLLPDPESIAVQDPLVSRYCLNPHTAYLKISEGCSHHCTYCIIPELRGKQRSRDPEEIAAEADKLVYSGIKELILVAQDTSFYGSDLNNSFNLDFLLKRLSEIQEKIWIRILYANPKYVDEDLIKTIAKNQSICSYLDIPVQHVSDSVLKAMGRKYRKNDLIYLFDFIRKNIPDIALRTTMMVGFPGETELNFNELIDFTDEMRFDHLGVFSYSDSKDLPSHNFKDHVPKDVKEERMHEIMSKQAEISFENQQKYIGKTLEVLIERPSKDEPGFWEGRTYFQAPEIDGITFVKKDNFQPGKWTLVKIIDALHYDLIGEVI
ncbi:Ribosomal protein uS12 methylthiotransferase RimO [Candidatus Magnetomoraceae bacterium gMMP-13]